MTRISISQPRHFFAPVIMALFLPLWFLKAFPLDGIRFSQLAFPLGVLMYIVLRIWIEVVRGSRVVEIDGDNGQVLIHSTSLLFRHKTTTFALSDFGSVRSYITPAKSSKNAVELVTVAGGEALPLVWFNPGSDKRRWLIPSEVESTEATGLRASISKVTGLRDDGFLGVRWVGKQIPD